MTTRTHDQATSQPSVLLDSLLDIKRLAEKSGDAETEPFTLLDLIAYHAHSAIASATADAILCTQDAAPELLDSLRDVLSRFRSCIAGGNGEIEGDREAIERANALIARCSR